MAASNELTEECQRHNKRTGGIAKFDCKGIFLFYYCNKCYEIKKSKYNPWVFSGYTQADVDEDIEPDDTYPEHYYYDD